MSQPLPGFSVIIPTRDRPAALARCLEALTAQDYSSGRFEVLVVDDGSRRPLDEAVEPFRDRLALRLIRQDNAGPGAARNRAADEARGRYLAFTDDDCLPEPGWLTAYEAAFEHSPDCLLGGRTVNHLTRNVYSSASQLIVDLVYSYYNRDPEEASFFASNNIAAPRELFARVGGFDPSFRVASEDRELCDRWRHLGFGLARVPDAVVRHAHEMGPAGYWRQHFCYGRGAARFHARCADRGSGGLTGHLGFYAHLPRLLCRHLAGVPVRRQFALAGLLAVWQCANVAGFLFEKVRGVRTATGERVAA